MMVLMSSLRSTRRGSGGFDGLQYLCQLSYLVGSKHLALPAKLGDEETTREELGYLATTTKLDCEGLGGIAEGQVCRTN
jgi:hypothetical protein